MNRISLLTAMLLLCMYSPAQEAQMADTFRSEGKIYVVITVLAIVFASVLAILLFIERRLTKLEKELNKSES